MEIVERDVHVRVHADASHVNKISSNRKYAQDSNSNESSGNWRNSKQSFQNQQLSNNSCFRCGRYNHSPQDCYYNNVKCHGCGQVGHIPRVCPRKFSDFIPRENKNDHENKKENELC